MVGMGKGDEFAINLLEGVDRHLDQFIEMIDDGQMQQGFGDLGAGDLAGLMPAHAVSDRPQAPVRADEDRVLVDLSLETDVGPADALVWQAVPPSSR